jgi:RNA polymerase sigma-70 factor (ECF subfamily)
VVTPEEFDGLYAACASRLVSQVALLTGDIGEAQDAVQEAFIRAWNHRDRIEVDAGAEGWVRTTAMRLAVSRWRRIRRSVLGTSNPDPTVAGPTPDHVALVQALRRLPEVQRTAIALHYFCDLSVEEVAFETRAPVGTVKARLSRGRAALAVALGDRIEEDSHVP